MELMSLQYGAHRLSLNQAEVPGLVDLFVDQEPVVKGHPLKENNRFELILREVGPVVLTFDFDMARQQVITELRREGEVLFSQAREVNLTNSAASRPKTSQGHLWAWLGVAFKLFKSVKVIQVALVGMSLSAWGILYSWEFAAAIVGILVFHEYGHLRAMKRCGIPTKGIYLIPFVGGVAVGDRARTHWQEVYVAMMGPFYGLAMTLVFGLGYYFTENHFLGLVTSIGALVNLFNLLPVLPLDGGHVFKAMALSGQKKAGLVTVGLLTCIGLVMAYRLGFHLLIFFLILGVMDLLASWRQFQHDPGMTMNAYGIGYSLVWYLVTAGAFIGVIVMMAGTGLPGTELAAAILRD